MRRLIVTIILVTIAAAGCSKTPVPRNYVNTANKFRINRPDGWDEVKDWSALSSLDVAEVGLDRSVDVAFLAPERTATASDENAAPNDHGAPPLPRAVIGVKTLNALANPTAMALFEREKANIIAKLTGRPDGEFTILKDGDFTTSNGKAYYVHCSWRKDRQEREGLLVFVVSARRAGMALCGCAKDDYAAFEEVFNKTCQSFYLDIEE